MTSPINLHVVAQFSAERMLNCLVEGVAIALFAWLLLRVIGLLHSGRQNSGTRFAVWLGALFAIAALPFVGTLLPAGAAASSAASRPAITVPGSWALYLFGIWAVIAILGLARVGVGLWQVRRVRRGCTEIDPIILDPSVRVTLREFISSRPVKICVSDTLLVPTAIGFMAPVVALPAWTIRDLSSTELNAILLHELAHLRRWDDWTNLAQKLLAAVFFFHPAVWWIESKLSLEREMACDDAVLAETANPRAYAECLVTVAEKSLMRRGLAMAQAAVSRVRQTSQRVAQILDKNRAGSTRVWMPALGMLGIFAMVCAGLLSHGPELVSFQDSAPLVISAAAIPQPMSSAHLPLTGTIAQPVKFVPVKPAHRTLQARPTVLAKVAAPQRKVETEIPVSLDAMLEPEQLERMLVPASFTLPDEIATSAGLTKFQQPQLKSVVLVYQVLQYDDAGFAHWTVCVWRVNVQPQVITVNPAKST